MSIGLRGARSERDGFQVVALALVLVTMAGCAGEPLAHETVTADTVGGVATDVAAADSASYRADTTWPALPTELELGEVSGVAVDSHGHVFVLHRGADRSVLCLDPEDGRVVASFGDGAFLNAHGLAVDHEDNVWVTDTRLHQVLKFDHDGALLMTLGEREAPGLDGEHFDQPTDVAISPAGEIYVSDGYGNSRVARFGPNGSFQLSWGEQGTGPGQFDLPHGITLDDTGRVYVADRSNQRVQVFEADGTFVEQWGEDVFGEGSRPWGLELHEGRLYVIDGGNMNPETPDFAQLTIVEGGRVIARWSGYGEAPGQLSWGHDVAVAPDGAVFTAEVRNNNRVQKFVR